MGSGRPRRAAVRLSSCSYTAALNIALPRGTVATRPTRPPRRRRDRSKGASRPQQPPKKKRSERAAPAQQQPPWGTTAFRDRDIVRQRMIAEKGYTNHLAGMYADKFTHPRLQCEGSHISIGDPYVDEAEITGPLEGEADGHDHVPAERGQRVIREHGQAVYVHARQVRRAAPLCQDPLYDTRKLGFGTHDVQARRIYGQSPHRTIRDLLKREAHPPAQRAEAGRPGRADPQGPQEISRSRRRRRTPCKGLRFPCALPLRHWAL